MITRLMHRLGFTLVCVSVTYDDPVTTEIWKWRRAR